MQVGNEINRLISIFQKDQLADGSWSYPFETGILTDCYMIILLRSLEINDEDFIRGLVNRILSRQSSDGAWRLFPDEHPGDLSLSIDAYHALLFSGMVSEKADSLLRAKAFIREQGGIEKAGFLTKFLLCLTGHAKWPAFIKIPVELILLPSSFPINFYSISIYGRSNLAPALIIADKKYSIKTDRTPDLSDLYTERSRDLLFEREIISWRLILKHIEKAASELAGLPEELNEKSLEKLKGYILNRIEEDGTFYSYFSASFYMVFSLLALGCSKSDRRIVKAAEGLKSMAVLIDGKPHCQYTTANLWNTSLISYTLQEAGLTPSHPMIRQANKYLLKRQHVKYGDWSVHSPSIKPGGWGFSHINTINPDVDDSTAVLRAFRYLAVSEKEYRVSWERGIDWVLGMQNSDGGWPSFERQADNILLGLLPGGDKFLIDPSSADLTGRTLEFFGRFTHADMKSGKMKKAVKWLLSHQEENGSWNSRWGIDYIYGTWAALTGLKAAGIPSSHPAILKALQWLYSIQNADGGWGESCNSDIQNKYVPLSSGTRTHTAWALDGLVSVSEALTDEMRDGINFLLKKADTNSWTEHYPKGQGAAGLFYIHYHSYEYIWPLLALVHVQGKYFN